MKNIKQKNNLLKSFLDFIYKIYCKNEEIYNYIIVGGLTTIISLLSYYICVLTILNPNDVIELQISNVISWICAVLFAYYSNRIFVFKSKKKNKIKESINFVGSRITTLLLDMLIMFFMVTILNINDKIAKLLVQVIIMISNYLISKFFVFKK